MRITAIIAATLLSSTRASYCGQYDSVSTGGYTLYNNLWNQSAATAGGQCFTVNGLSNGVLSWATNWNWTGGAGQVKSYANAVASVKAAPVSAFGSLKSQWSWTYTGSNIVADVAYDLFTSSSPGGNDEFELMVWLAALGGAGPISATYNAQGHATPIATTNIAGVNWSLYKGRNRQLTVYSFVASSRVTSFNGDLLSFYKFLASRDGFSMAQYLKSAGAGTEAFTGSDALFTTTSYSFTAG